jgi:hypothetical protein
MLFKWVLLLVIAWYVSKAFGNLILTMRGQPIPPPRPVDSRPKEGVYVSRPEAERQRSNEPRQVEDARFEDL